MNDQATPTPAQRIQDLEEQLDALHDRNLSLEFRLKQAEYMNAEHEEDYLAVWKALRPRHGAGFQRDYENIAQAVQRLVKEIPEALAAVDHYQTELRKLERHTENSILTGLQFIPGGMGPDTLLLKLTTGRVLQIGLEGCNLYASETSLQQCGEPLAGLVFPPTTAES